MARFRPIEEKWLKSNELFALGWAPQQLRSPSWTFHRVVAVEPTQIKPFDNGLKYLPYNNLTTLAGVLLQDANNKKVFEVTDDYKDRLVMHAGIGVSPEWETLRVYPEYPTGDRHGYIPNFDAPVAPRLWGYVTGADSPYDEPTEGLEFFFPHKVDAALSILNLDEQQEEVYVTLNIQIRKYLMEVLQASDPLVGRIARREVPCYFFPVGRIETPHEFPSDTQAAWGGVTPLSLATARGVR